MEKNLTFVSLLHAYFDVCVVIKQCSHGNYGNYEYCRIVVQGGCEITH